MNLPRHNITSHAPAPVFVNAHFCSVPSRSSNDGSKAKDKDDGATSSSTRATRSRSSSYLRKGTGGDQDRHAGKLTSAVPDGAEQLRSESMIACATREGFFVARSDPFTLVARRDFPAVQGGLAHAALIDDSSLMVLVGGGRVPRFAPNKVILWDEDADVKIPVRRRSSSVYGDLKEATAATALHQDGNSDEDTASLAPSTVFSVGRELHDEGESGESIEHADLVEANAATRATDEVDSRDIQGSVTSDDSIGGIHPLLQDSKHSEGRSHSSGLETPNSPTLQQEDGMAKSTSASLSASSANMEDPFGGPSPPLSEDDSMSNRQSRNQADASPDVAALPLDDETSQQPDEPEFRIVKGREVAELEFGEAVESIAVRSFAVHNDIETDEQDEIRHASSSTATLLVVSLKREAVIFELGAHLAEKPASSTAPSLPATSWGIRQRMTVQCHTVSARCEPSMAAIKGTNCALIALPGRQAGHVQLISLAFSQTTRTSIDSSIAGASTIIAAHSNAIACIALSPDARLLCTASERGTLLRVWNTFDHRGKAATAQQINVTLQGELRRGTDAARILSMAWTPDNRLLAAASDKGTVHLFSVESAQHNPIPTAMAAATSTSPRGASSGFTLSRQANRYLPSALQQFAQSLPTSFVPTYFRSQWSFAQFKISLRVFSGRTRDGLKYVEPPPPSRRRAQRPRQAPPDGGPAQFAAEARSASTEHTGLRDDDVYDEPENSFPSIGDAIVPDRARNLDGGWATLRGRVQDIRRGERSIEESIWLAWVPARAATATALGSESAATATASSTSGTSSFPASTKRTASTPSIGVLPYHLIAVTSAGGHYRLAASMSAAGDVATDARTPSSSSLSAAQPSSTTVLNMYKHDSRSGREAGQDAKDVQAGSCWLVEYTPFGMRDEWLE